MSSFSRRGPSFVIRKTHNRRDYSYYRWWCNIAGLKHRDVVAWYEPIGAPSQALSYRDLSVYTGKWNATEVNGMDWQDDEGWSGNSTGSYHLTTNLNAKTQGIVSAFARLNGSAGGSDQMLFGSSVAAGNSKFYIKPYAGSSSPGIEFANGGSRNDGPTNYQSSGTLAMTPTKQYRDGVPQGGTIAALNQALAMKLMAENQYGSPAGFFNGTVQLILFFRTILTDVQIAALHTAAMLLPEGGAWAHRQHHLALETADIDHLLLENSDYMRL